MSPKSVLSLISVPGWYQKISKYQTGINFLKKMPIPVPAGIKIS
jgi:hypothetical protein